MAKKGRKKNEDGPHQGGEDAAKRQLLIDAWKARDELYSQLFGTPAYATPSSYAPPSPVVKRKRDEDRSAVDGGSGDPGNPANEDQHLAVLAYGPDPFRPYWTYVTAGISSPWLQEQPDEVSGFGCELMIKSPVDAPWAATILRSMAFYIFNHAGTISPGVRIGLNAPIKEHSDSLLRNLFVWYADEAPEGWYILPSGGFGLFCAVGMTEEECRFAESIEEYGTWCIQEALRRLGIGQVSDPDRANIILDANAEMLNGVRNYAIAFGADLAARSAGQQVEEP